MNKEDFTKAMVFLGTAYHKDISQEQVAVWYTFFRDVDFELFKTAISRLINKSKFMPSIAEIKSELSEITMPMLQLDAGEEWEKVVKAIRHFGIYRANEAVATLHPVTAKVVKRLGGFGKMCISTSGDWDRQNFLKMFDAYQAREKEIYSMNDRQLTVAELTRKAESKAYLLEAKDD